MAVNFCTMPTHSTSGYLSPRLTSQLNFPPKNANYNIYIKKITNSISLGINSSNRLFQILPSSEQNYTHYTFFKKFVLCSRKVLGKLSGKIVRYDVPCGGPPIVLKSLNNFIIQLCYSTVTTTYCKQEWDILHSQKLSYSTFPTAILLKDTIKKALLDLILFFSIMSRKKEWCSSDINIWFLWPKIKCLLLYAHMNWSILRPNAFFSSTV